MTTGAQQLIRLHTATLLIRGELQQRLRDDSGEGVISAAIAVLIMAFLGAAMWVAFDEIWQRLLNTTNDQVNRIGSAGDAG